MTGTDVSPGSTGVGTMSLSFTEEMRGWLSLGDEGTRARSLDEGVHKLSFRLVIRIRDLAAHRSDPGHPAEASGWVHCDVLGGRLAVSRGWFSLFVHGSSPGEQRMLYHLQFCDGVGHPLTLSGHKDLDGGGIRAVWPKTTTLLVELRQGHVADTNNSDAQTIGRGELRLGPIDFLRQLSTMRVTGSSRWQGWLGLLGFGSSFVRHLSTVFGPLRRLSQSNGRHSRLPGRTQAARR